MNPYNPVVPVASASSILLTGCTIHATRDRPRDFLHRLSSRLCDRDRRARFVLNPTAQISPNTSKPITIGNIHSCAISNALQARMEVR